MVTMDSYHKAHFNNKKLTFTITYIVFNNCLSMCFYSKLHMLMPMSCHWPLDWTLQSWSSRLKTTGRFLQVRCVGWSQFIMMKLDLQCAKKKLN